MSTRDDYPVNAANPKRSDRDPGGRRSVGRPPIPAERIIATAMRIVDDGGAEALSRVYRKIPTAVRPAGLAAIVQSRFSEPG